MRMLIAFVLVVSFPLFSSSVDQTIEDGLKILFYNDFGYTLIGEKPVSQSDNLSAFLNGGTLDANKVLLFLNNLFASSPNFIVRLPRTGCIELIHVKCLLSQINSSHRLNKFILNKFESKYMFLKALKESRENIFSLLDNDQVIIGTVLGYGEKNSIFYSRRQKVGTALKKFPVYMVYPFDDLPSPFHVRDYTCFIYPHASKPVSCDSRFASLEEEWQWLKSVEVPTEVDELPELPFNISLPGYASMKCKESRRLYENYVHARDKLARLFCGRKFSEVIAEEAAKK